MSRRIMQRAGAFYRAMLFIVNKQRPMYCWLADAPQTGFVVDTAVGSQLPNHRTTSTSPLVDPLEHEHGGCTVPVYHRLTAVLQELLSTVLVGPKDVESS